jgi:hypothetical protein
MTHPLLHRINRFLATSGLKPSQFGRYAVRDPRLINDLRNGREPGNHLIARIEHFMNTWHQSAAGEP